MFGCFLSTYMTCDRETHSSYLVRVFQLSEQTVTAYKRYKVVTSATNATEIWHSLHGEGMAAFRCDQEHCQGIAFSAFDLKTRPDGKFGPAWYTQCDDATCRKHTCATFRRVVAQDEAKAPQVSQMVDTHGLIASPTDACKYKYVVDGIVGRCGQCSKSSIWYVDVVTSRVSENVFHVSAAFSCAQNHVCYVKTCVTVSPSLM